MARKKEIDDAAFRILLRSYRRPSLDDEALEGIFARAAEGGEAPRAIASTGRREFSPPRFGAAARLATAAGLALALGLGGLALLRPGELDSPYALAGAEGEAARRTRAGVLESGEGELRLSTPSESLVLAEHGRLRIDSDPWRRIGGERGNRYALERGRLYIDHAAERGSFALVLPWGTARPLGTALSCRVDEGGADLYCLSGSLSFDAVRGSKYIITQGMVLRIRAGGRDFRLEAAAGGDAPFRPAPSYPAGATPAPGAAREASPPPPRPRLEAPRGGGAEPPAVDASRPAGLETRRAPPIARSWSRELGAPPLELLADERWAVVAFEKELLVLDQADGRELARTELGEAIKASARRGDRLFLYAGAGLRSLRLPGLEELWRASTGNLAFTGFSLAGERLYLPSAEGKLYVHELGDGRLVGSVDAGVGLYGRPLVADGRIIVSGLDKRLLAFRESDGEKLWEYRAAGRLVDDRPVAIGHLVVDYTREGGIFALDARSGALVWEVAAGSPIAQPPEAWGRLLAYRDGAGAKALTADGLVSALGPGSVARLEPGTGGYLYLAGPGGVERRSADGEIEALSAEGALLAMPTRGALLILDEKYRLTRYETEP
jgi:hypothetical protein